MPTPRSKTLQINFGLSSQRQTLKASNWIERIKKYDGPNPPIPEPTSRCVPEAADKADRTNDGFELTG